MRSRYAGRPFTTSTAEIAAALEDVSIPTLLLSLVHITGDPRFIRDFKQMGVFLNEVQGFMSEEDKARARAEALSAITEYRDRGCPEPEPLSLELIREMMDWTACEHVPDDYLALVSEELDLDGVDPRRPAALPTERTDDLPVLVVGCGESGILAGIRLKQANIGFTIVEKNPGPGGTWWENTYPGARVDVANHFYCYSFEPNNDWTHFFAEQHELRDYFTKVIDKHDLAEHIRWNTEVVEAKWNDDDGMWTVSLRVADGQTSTVRARAVITAVGQLNRPHIPDIDGADTFEGPSFHSAAWDHAVDLTGKRVALIGAGASGFQIAPAIADDVEHLTVFQRTAQWMFPNPMYHDQVGDGVRWAMRHLPFYGRWYRFLVLWPGSDKGLDAAEGDPNYADQDHAVSDINAAAHMMFSQWITSQVGEGPNSQELLAKVMPDYPACGKRTLQDNGSWLQTLQRDERRTGAHPDSGDHRPRGGHRRRCGTPRGRHRVRHRIPTHRRAVAAKSDRPQRNRPARDVGEPTVCLPRHHRSGFPQLLHRLRAGHASRARRQPDLPVRTADALRGPVFGAAGRRRRAFAGTNHPSRRRLASADADPDQENGVGASRGQALLFQERRRGNPHRQPLAAQ